jgi:prepilin-type N-terminal cleavage/methylation domain-containing protein
VKNRDGFTLTEVLVSVVLLGAILAILGGLTLSTARQADTTGRMSQRQAYSMAALNRASTMPWAMLTVGTNCDTVGAVRNRFERCGVVTQNGAGRDVVLTVRSLDSKAPPSIVRFTRASPIAPQNPLCTLGGC